MFVLKSTLKRIKAELKEDYDDKLDVIRCRLDLDDATFDAFHADRLTDEFNSAFDSESPLVSVCICTFNRGELLTERAVSSILDQTYRNIELIVVGDHCTDDTEKLMSRFDDARVTFVNLPERGKYPENPMFRWMVAGTTPVNHALSLAKGHFITHLDDDDRHAPDRIEKLVTFAQTTRSEFVWHPFFVEKPDGRWKLNEAERFASSQVTTSSVFYHHWLKRIPWDVNAYRFREPGDWNRFRKFKYLGVSAQRYPEPLLYHYRERNQ